MSLQFSAAGPLFPPKLLDAMLAGEVVFVCGAGVSAPQLLGFEGLVDRLYEHLDLERSPGEQTAFEAKRFEEVLGSLSRRLIHPRRLYDEVATLLVAPPNVDLTQHNVLLRLSRDLSNRVSLITTNFDLLFELAITAQSGHQAAADVSFAGQALPTPGAEDFAGVIHLHGRLASPDLGLDETQLVLTSAEYGDAYMRSGWASRFLFDLTRCKTLVLVGYSASDAPIRYFLNVLEADRDRFTDLKPVYALDAFDNDPEEVAGRWSTLAVQALPYRRTIAGKTPHAALWEDLAKLAELVERPKPSRQQQIEAILKDPFESSTGAARETLDWLQRNRGDLWNRIIANVEDPAWFDHFTRAGLWSPGDSEWLLPDWFARDWTSITRLHAAVRWLETPNRKMALNIEQELARKPPVEGAWRRAWHVLAQSTLRRATATELDDYSHAQKLRRPDVFDLDLREAIDALTPQVTIKIPDRFGNEPEGEPSYAHLRDFYDVRVGRSITTEDHHEVLAALLERLHDARRLSQLASDALRNTIAVATDLDLLSRWDELDYSLPSVAEHAQNEFHGGVLPLVRLLAGFLPGLAIEDRDLARGLAQGWATLASFAGRRLWLHALTLPTLFDPDEVATAVLSLPEADFWAHRPELPRLLTARFAEASPVQRQAVADRILNEGPRQLDNYEPQPGETDWRPAALAHATWLLLTALRDGGALTVDGQAQLDAIRRAHPFLGEALEDHDYFPSYSGPIRSVAADPTPLLDAEPGDQLDLAHKMVASPEPDGRRGWAAFCQAQPEQAFVALSQGGFRDEDSNLWRDLLSGIWYVASGDNAASPNRANLLHRIFTFLADISREQTLPLLSSLVDAFRAASKLSPALRAHWWDKLWDAATAADDGTLPGVGGRQFYDRVINSAAGKLAEELLKWIDAQHKTGNKISKANWTRLRKVFRSDTPAGHIGRGACMRAVAFLTYLDCDFVERWVAPWLDKDGDAAAMLRSLYAQWSPPTALSSRLLKPIILRCAQEATGSEDNCRLVAQKILLPLVRRQLTDGKEDWGFEDGDTRRALVRGSNALRVAAAQVFAQWHRAKDTDPQDLWQRAVKPIFKSVWPVEKRFKSSEISRHLAAMSVLTGDHFPDAVDTIGPYLTAGDQPGGLFFFHDAPVRAQFPRESLTLLWMLLKGCPERFSNPEVAWTLDAIKAAAPDLETDRRFQWLETKATRFA